VSRLSKGELFRGAPPIFSRRAGISARRAPDPAGIAAASGGTSPALPMAYAAARRSNHWHRL